MLFVKDACFLRLAVDYKDKDSIFVMMDVTAALQNLSTNLSVDEKSIIKKELSAYLNYLLINDFAALVQILYRVDVSEQRLKTVLKENKEADAGDLLTELIIQRQEEKSISRRGTPPADTLADEESW